MSEASEAIMLLFSQKQLVSKGQMICPCVRIYSTGTYVHSDPLFSHLTLLMSAEPNLIKLK